jgi:DNA replication protein DnaC
VITPKSDSYDWAFNTLGDPKLEKVLIAVKEFASGWILKEQGRWLTLSGTTGTGKTHLAKKLCACWNERGGHRIISESMTKPLQLQPAFFVKWTDFVDSQRAGEYGEMEKLKRAHYVALDDIGTERDPTDFAKELLYKLLNAREGKWTVITTNLTLEAIKRDLDVRVASRIVRGTNRLVQFTIADYALRMWGQ